MNYPRRPQDWTKQVDGHNPSELGAPGDSDIPGDAPTGAGEIHPAAGAHVDDSSVQHMGDGQPHPGAAQGEIQAPTPRKGKSGQTNPGLRPRKPGPPNPFSELLESEVAPLLEADVDGKLQASAVVDHLIAQYPERFVGMKRKSLCKDMQRFFSKWRQEHGKVPACRWQSRPGAQHLHTGKRPLLTMEQEHPPGREAQIDFTSCNNLHVTIKGECYPHELSVFRLSYSSWIHVDPATAENASALMQGLQRAMWDLGGVPEVVRSDNAGCVIQNRRPTRPYQDFLHHYDLKITLINPGRPRENGGVEGGNGLVKTAIDQALRIRGNRDFASKKEYASFVREQVNRLNLRTEVQSKLAVERVHLRPLPPEPAPEYVMLKSRVQKTSFIKVAKCRYSVPARALGEMVTVHLYADHLEVYRYDGRRLTRWERLRGKNKVIADPRHLIGDVLQMPRGFERWDRKVKKLMFPLPVFRKCYDGLRGWDKGGADSTYYEANYGYLRILYLALQANRVGIVAGILEDLLKQGSPFGYADVKKELARLLGWPEEEDDPKDQAPKDQVWWMKPLF